MTRDEILAKLSKGDIQVDEASRLLAELEGPKHASASIHGDSKGNNYVRNGGAQAKFGAAAQAVTLIKNLDGYVAFLKKALVKVETKERTKERDDGTEETFTEYLGTVDGKLVRLGYNSAQLQTVKDFVKSYKPAKKAA